MTEVSPDPKNPEINECVFDTAAKYAYYRFVVNEVHDWDNGKNPLYAVLERIDLLDAIIGVTRVIIDPAACSIRIGENKQLTFTVEPENATYIKEHIFWGSLQNDVASVDENTGIVTGKSNGVATIFASYLNKTGNCRVTVGTPPADKVTDVIIKNPPQKALSVGSAVPLYVEVLPSSANQKVSWTVRGHSPIAVSVDNQTIDGARIVAVNPGTAIVTARSVGNYTESASCEVTVVGYPQKIMIDAGHVPGWNSFNHTYNGQNFTYCEGDRMWDLQEMLIEELQNIGFINTKRLRVNNSDNTSQEERGKKAEEYDLFIQLHSNGAVIPGTEVLNPDPDRAEIFYPIGSNSDTIKLGESIVAAIKTTMELKEESSVSIKRYENDPNHPDYNRNYFAVLRGAISVNCFRCFLVENSFHTNPRAAHWLMQNDNLQKLAKAYANAIKNHFLV